MLFLLMQDPSPQDALLENKVTGYMEKRERQMSSKVTSQWVPAVGRGLLSLSLYNRILFQ